MRIRVLVGLVAALGVFSAAMGQNSPSDSTASRPSEVIKRGEYLARAGDCVSSTPEPGGGTPYAGGMRMKTPFGDLITPNITPNVRRDSARGPASIFTGRYTTVSAKRWAISVR